MHVQTSPVGGPQRLPFGTGQLEVIRLDRLRYRSHQTAHDDADRNAVRAVVQAEGRPASTRSIVRRARFAFMGPGTLVPLSRVDLTRELLLLYYPIEEYGAVMGLLATSGRRMCYCWTSADQARSVVMLMAM